MPIYQDKARGRLVFEFDRYIHGHRIRARHLLPKGWSRAQADTFDRRESARLYAVATGVEGARHSIDAAVARYLSDHAPSLKHAKNLLIELRAMREWFEGRPMQDLPAVCAEYLAAQRRHLAPATIRNRIAYLRAACRWAWKHHGMAESDPGARIVSPAVNNGRQVYLDRGQMLALAKACGHKGARAMIRVAWYSGMRLGEIERATPDFKAGVLVLTDSKNGEPRHVPMHPRILTCLRNYAWPTRYTFGYWFRE
jgi:integrase